MKSCMDESFKGFSHRAFKPVLKARDTFEDFTNEFVHLF